MYYKVILQKGNYALIDRGKVLKEFAVVSGLNEDKKEWDYTCCQWFYQYKEAPSGVIQKPIALQAALDYFRVKTEENYISRPRLEELATKFKDGLIEFDKEYAEEYFDQECEMDYEEKAWFEIF